MLSAWPEIVKGFKTTPFLFVGSGLSRRYLQLPCWRGLLLHFASKVSSNEYYFSKLLDEADKDLSVVGRLLERDFNRRWYDEPDFGTKDASMKDAVLNREVSPFKAEVARYLTNSSTIDSNYSTEIDLLKSLADRHLSGFITTNYDTLLEKIDPFYKTFVGQEDLLLSNPQGIAEIFKIHGTVKDPNSLVLTDADYKEFIAKRAYLAAKLLTIFIEYPVIFIGYRLGDQNVQAILASIIDCLDKDQDKIDKLANSLIFVERDKNLPSSIEIEKQARVINGKTLLMTNVRTDDFLQLFEGLKETQRGAPVKLLRMFREERYEYSVTSKPSKNLVVNVGDPRIPENKVVFSIGVEKKSSEKGLIGISRSEWFKEIILEGTSGYKPEQLLSIGYRQVKKTSGGSDLPVFKFLASLSSPFPNIDEISEAKRIKTYDDLISPTLRKQRDKGLGPKNIKELFSFPRYGGKSIYKFWALLPEREVVLEELEKFLFVKFRNDSELLTTNKDVSSDIYRLIRIYDWLKFGKNKPVTKNS